MTATVAPSAVKARIADAWLGTREVPPTLGEITLAPHQREAVARILDLIDEVGGAVLADEAGMGKTFVALAVARAMDGFVVVAPAALRDTWRRALARTGLAGRFLSFEELSRGRSLPDERLPLVIVDEAHHARNPRTRRYAALARLTWGAPVLLLTATPVHNRMRDLRSQLALFLGARAWTLGSAALGHLVVRRRHTVLPAGGRLPAVQPLRWLATPPDPAILRAIADLPPAVPPADGGQAHALLRLGLVRAWTSSAAALQAALTRRLRQATALTAALESGRFPTRQELGAWTVIDGAVQLAFPELVAELTLPGRADRLADAITHHVDGARRILEALRQGGDPDGARAAHLCRVRAHHAGRQIVALTQYVETARALFTRLVRTGGVALVTAHGARIASGRVRRGDILAQFAPEGADAPARTNPRLRVDLLLATDVLSEGLDLHRASVLVHLDLPWTAARLEQRLGRVRRIGAPHDRVYVYAIGPPPRARELSAVVRALQRKLRLVTSLVGPPDAVLMDEALGSRARLNGGPDLASTVERVRAGLRIWRNASEGEPDDPGVLCAVRCARPRGIAWQALALVSSGTRHRLVVLDPHGAAEHPERVLAFLADEREATDAAGDDAASKVALGSARAAAHTWLAAQRGAHTIDLAVQAPSPAHTGILRWLDRRVALANRHERHAVVELVTTCRTLVLGARGAGAEAFLARWLHGVRKDAGGDTEGVIANLIAALVARSQPNATGADASPMLRALMVLVHRTTPEPDNPAA